MTHTLPPSLPYFLLTSSALNSDVTILTFPMAYKLSIELKVVSLPVAAMPLHDAAISQSIPVGALATALANAPPAEQRTMLGENLYPLVEQLEPEMAAKVTGMFLEMDQTEVLHLLESPDALKAKVTDAMEVLRNVVQQQQATNAADQLGSLPLE
ncbi:polyadenylate-binding protein 8 [Vitis riparia]|uniref:polyadenylate-binding protein 8 n=1 Tax=Vitis riparia TaxID=96939 RepID=UPI00155B2B1D|nr:polyadenylate-binding protein 8 [Vitis riparia]